MNISAIDALIVVAYLIGVMLFGLWIGRGQRDSADYFLGARSLPWWALLLSIVLPALKMVKEKGRQTVCSSHLKGIGVGVTAFLAENDNVFHVGANYGLWENWVDGSGVELQYEQS